MRKTIIAALAVLIALAGKAQSLYTNEDSPLEKLRLAERAIQFLYVDSVDEGKLVEDAIRGMLKELDPHSSYTTAKETKQMTEPLVGSFEGIGVQFNMVQDTLLVVQTISGGPSEKVGIMAGDRIVAVNDTAIAGVKMTREEIMRRLRGPKGTKANLSIVRRGIEGKLDFVVTRDKIPVTTLDAAYMIRPGVGYFRIGSFGAKTYDEFMAAVDSLRQLGMHDIIIDLQENGGGYLQTAVQIANEFLDKGDLIVYTEGRATRRQDFSATGHGKLRQGRVVVLINEYSASASEILSGAIQDHDRGMIVGRRSFGKGLVQRPLEFNDGSMMRLTMAHYYTPTGRCIQKPYEKGDKADYDQDIEQRFKHGELYCRDSIQFADSLKFFTLKQHREVYGGGGIMPDYFVPLDTTQYTAYHRQLAAKSCIINTTLKYVDGHRSWLTNKYKTFDNFNAHFECSDDLLADLFAEGEKSGVKLKNEEERQQSLQQIKLQMKALIARDLWQMNDYYRIINEGNHIVQEALKVLENK